MLLFFVFDSVVFEVFFLFVFVFFPVFYFFSKQETLREDDQRDRKNVPLFAEKKRDQLFLAMHILPDN